MEGATKNVLLSSGGDEISKNLALHLARRGCRFIIQLITWWFCVLVYWGNWEIGEHYKTFCYGFLSSSILYASSMQFLFTVVNLISIFFIAMSRLVLIGNECVLQSMSKMIAESLKGVLPIEVVGLDMEEEREAVFDEAVNRACSVLGTLDAFVHAYSYEGTTLLSVSSILSFHYCDLVSSLFSFWFDCLGFFILVRCIFTFFNLYRISSIFPLVYWFFIV